MPGMPSGATEPALTLPALPVEQPRPKRSRSIKVTFNPARSSVEAESVPTIPPPMTTTWRAVACVSSVIGSRSLMRAVDLPRIGDVDRQPIRAESAAATTSTAAHTLSSSMKVMMARQQMQRHAHAPAERSKDQCEVRTTRMTGVLATERGQQDRKARRPGPGDPSRSGARGPKKGRGRRTKPARLHPRRAGRSARRIDRTKVRAGSRSVDRESVGGIRGSSPACSRAMFQAERQSPAQPADSLSGAGEETAARPADSR